MLYVGQDNHVVFGTSLSYYTWDKIIMSYLGQVCHVMLVGLLERKCSTSTEMRGDSRIKGSQFASLPFLLVPAKQMQRYVHPTQLSKRRSRNIVPKFHLPVG